MVLKERGRASDMPVRGWNNGIIIAVTDCHWATKTPITTLTKIKIILLDLLVSHIVLRNPAEYKIFKSSF